MSSSGPIVFLDYDGTLLTPRDDISNVTRAALNRALAAGVRVIPASGRPLVGLHLRGGPRLEVAIALNGAVVRKQLDGSPWETEEIPACDVRACVDLARALGVQVNVYTACAWFADLPTHPRVLSEQRRIGARPSQLRGGRLGLRGVHKVLLLGPATDLDPFDGLLASVETTTELQSFRSNPACLEIGRADVSKRTGIDVVRGWVGPGRTYAIGDGPPDVAMFECVDVAIAMGNAPKAVKNRADVIMRPNHASGVADALNSIARGAL